MTGCLAAVWNRSVTSVPGVWGHRQRGNPTLLRSPRAQRILPDLLHLGISDISKGPDWSKQLAFNFDITEITWSFFGNLMMTFLSSKEGVFLKCCYGMGWIFLEIYRFLFCFFKSTPKDVFLLLVEREEGREEEREKNRCKRDAAIGCLPYLPRPEIELTIQVHVLTGNWTRSPSAVEQCSSELSHTDQGWKYLVLFVIMLASWQLLEIITSWRILVLLLK